MNIIVFIAAEYGRLPWGVVTGSDNGMDVGRGEKNRGGGADEMPRSMTLLHHGVRECIYIVKNCIVALVYWLILLI